MPRAIWIDCDPGQDDAVMLLLTLARRDALDARGISAVAGNVPVDLGARNAVAVVELAGRPDVPVFAGCDRPLGGAPRPPDARRGETGLEGWVPPNPETPLQAEHAVDALIVAARDAGPNGLTIVATGPLTNIAMALDRAPDIVPCIGGIALMGGVADAGPRAPAAEFNFASDPQAARIVLGCGRPLAIFGLDVTLQAVATKARRARIAAAGTRAARAVDAMLAFTDPLGRAAFGTDGAPLHDPCPLAWLLEPDLFAGRDAQVSVDGDGRLSLVADAPANARWIDRIDADAYFDLIARALATLP